MGHLVVSIGANDDQLQRINLKSNSSILIQSPHFEGQIRVRVLGGKTPQDNYFNDVSRLFSFQIQGQFKKQSSKEQISSWTADDIMFGVEQFHPMHLPLGVSWIGSFIRAINPTTDIILQNKVSPCILSPLVSAASIMNVSDLDQSHPSIYDEKYNKNHFKEDTFLLFHQKLNEKERKQSLATSQQRQSILISKDLYHSFDFYSPFVDFHQMQIKMGLRMSIEKYVRQEPIRFVCRSRRPLKSKIRRSPFSPHQKINETEKETIFFVIYMGFED